MRDQQYLRGRVQTLATLALLFATPSAAAENLGPALARLETGWAQARFATQAPADKLALLDRLLASASALQQQAPGRAEPLVWRGVLLATKAGVVHGLTGFALVQDARTSLEAAASLAPAAENGLGLIQLGILYYRVPGPPIGFGDRRRAKALLTQALAVDSQGLAANLALAEYFVEAGRHADAEPLLVAALAAPPRADQPLADRGRRAEAAALLKVTRSRLGK